MKATAIPASEYRGNKYEIMKGLVLDFDKPQKVRSTEEHNDRFQSDAGVAGTFVPNMSEEDKNKWKAKHIKGEDERIEIRKTLDSQLVIIVYKNSYRPPYPKEYLPWEEYHRKQKEWHNGHEDIRISMNGPCQLTFKDYNDLMTAVYEASMLLGHGVIDQRVCHHG